MVSILYHARTNGFVVSRLAKASDGKIAILRDRNILPNKVNGTLIRWDSKKELDADRVINTAQAVKLSRNKRDSRFAMKGLCPETWNRLEDLEYPCLIRPKRHYAARGFFVCHDRAEARLAIREIGRLRFYASPIINKKLEYRIFVFQGHIVKVVRRFHDNPNEVAWNIANGGKSVRLKRESWPIESCKVAILAGRAIGLDWFAADVIVDADGKPFVLELNTAPGLDREETFKNLAKLFVWADQGVVPVENNLKGQTWKTLIHPALT